MAAQSSKQKETALREVDMLKKEKNALCEEVNQLRCELHRARKCAGTLQAERAIAENMCMDMRMQIGVVVQEMQGMCDGRPVVLGADEAWRQARMEAKKLGTELRGNTEQLDSVRTRLQDVEEKADAALRAQQELKSALKDKTDELDDVHARLRQALMDAQRGSEAVGLVKELKALLETKTQELESMHARLHETLMTAQKATETASSVQELRACLQEKTSELEHMHARWHDALMVAQNGTQALLQVQELKAAVRDKELQLQHMQVRLREARDAAQSTYLHARQGQEDLGEAEGGPAVLHSQVKQHAAKANNVRHESECGADAVESPSSARDKHRHVALEQSGAQDDDHARSQEAKDAEEEEEEGHRELGSVSEHKVVQPDGGSAGRTEEDTRRYSPGQCVGRNGDKTASSSRGDGRVATATATASDADVDTLLLREDEPGGSVQMRGKDAHVMFDYRLRNFETQVCPVSMRTYVLLCDIILVRVCMCVCVYTHKWGFTHGAC
jgi:hypothetical protein